MKKCEYCNKEISYHEQYCSKECEDKSLKFYTLRENFTSIFSVLNGIFVLCIGIGIFVFSLHHTAGSIMITASLLILGVVYFLFPFPTEIMIHKYKLKKAIEITKIIAIALFTLGIIALILSIIFVY